LNGAVSVIGTAQFGQQLAVDMTCLTTAPGTTLGSITYQWKRAGANITGATDAAYTPVQADIGQALAVTVAAGNGTGAMTSDLTTRVVKAEGPAAPVSPTRASSTTTEITLNLIPGAEYMLVVSEEWGEPYGEWQDSVTFDSLTPNTGYIFCARIKETATHVESLTSAFSAPIMTRSSETTPGDINGDGVVDALDLGILIANYGKSGASITNPAADINGDGVVDALDLGILIANYGR